MAHALEELPVKKGCGAMQDCWQKIYVSQTFERITVLKSVDILFGKLSPFDFISPEQVGNIIHQIIEGVSTDKDHFVFDFDVKIATGEVISTRKWIQERHDQSGKAEFYGYIAIYKDQLGDIETAQNKHREFF